jgi:hypothetical protein
LRLKTHEWTEEDFGSLIREYADHYDGVKPAWRQPPRAPRGGGTPG